MQIAEYQTTIAAIATPRGTGGIAVIRLSGPQSWAIAQALASKKKTWFAGQIVYDWLQEPTNGVLLDEVLILPFKAPSSFTGEDCIELHCHGGLVVSRMILTHCLQLGAVAAEAGEFTKRALLNGRIDLTQAESILDLIQAQGETLAKLAAHNLHHRAVGNLLEAYLRRISEIQAELTASIDFPEEVDEPDRLLLAEALQVLSTEIGQHIAQAQAQQVLREGIEVALIGRPNAGKSSLFNALLAADRAIVTEIAGTTRDVLREPLSIQGIPVILTDTAGLRESGDQVEVLGVARSWHAIESAQLIVYVVDGTLGLTPEDIGILAKLADRPGLLVYNKADQADFKPVVEHALWPALSASATGMPGSTAILDWLNTAVGAHAPALEAQYVLSQRQMGLLQAVQSELDEAQATLMSPIIPLDLATVPLTQALLEIERLLGKDTTELVLDAVFQKFCVGK